MHCHRIRCSCGAGWPCRGEALRCCCSPPSPAPSTGESRASGRRCPASTTIFLATAPAFTFVGLLAGTLLGHALVTGLAVGAGKWIGGRISEKLLYRLSGGLFLAFGLVSLKQALA